MMLAPIIFFKDSLMRLKRKRLDPTVNLKEVRRGQAVEQSIEIEEEEEGDAPCPSHRRRGKRQLLQKRKQVASGSSSSPKRAKVQFVKFQQHSLFYLFGLNMLKNRASLC